MIELEFYLRTSKSLSWGVDESTVPTHLGLYFDRFSVFKCTFLSLKLINCLEFQVYRHGDKAYKKSSKKEQRKLKMKK